MKREAEDVKKELEKIFLITKACESKKRQIAALEDEKTSFSSSHIDGMPKIKGCSLYEKVNFIIDRVDELQYKITKDMKELLKVRDYWMDKINKLKIDEMVVIELYYIELLSVPEISEKLHYDKRQIYRIRAKALENLAIISNENENWLKDVAKCTKLHKMS